MPDTLAISTSVSLGLLAGIVSGVCYLVANGFTVTKARPRSKKCLKPSEDGVCRSCGGDGGKIPCICHIDIHTNTPVKFESGAWFLRQVQKAISLMPWSFSTDKLDLIEEEHEDCDSPEPSDRGDLRNVRDFLEALSATLAGGPLEGTRVAPLYDHPAYQTPRTSSPTSSTASAPRSSASGAHAQLKRLVARVVEEAAALPALQRYAAQTAPVESSTYEDLLATAILNKVIERYQTENGSGGRSSGIHSASASPTPSERSSPRELHSRTMNISSPLREEDVSDWEEGEATASDEALDLPRRVPFREFGGDIDHKKIDNEERDFDEVSGGDIQTIDGTWEENWLFQKKKIKTLQSVPVPMLVPNSNTDYRALIGDRDADDTTDLSDNASDEEEDVEYKSNVKRVLDSKHVIGGKPKIDEIYEPDSLNFEDDFEDEDEGKIIDAINNEINDISNKKIESINSKDSVLIYGIESGPLPKAEFALKEEIHRKLLNGNSEQYEAEVQLNDKVNGEVGKDEVDSFVNHKGSNNTLSRPEREGEYEETVTIPVQRYADSLRRKHFEDDAQQVPTRDIDKEEDLIPGSIAYRERKKWLNYVEMPNNPYSPEAIQKRLTAKSTSSLFDMITKKEFDEESIKSEIIDTKNNIHDNDLPEKDNAKQSTVNVDIVTNGHSNGRKSPSPRILKEVIEEEIPQYKRYGRDYYIREAKKSSGSRKKNGSEQSLSSLDKSTSLRSLENIDTEFTSPGLLIKQFNMIASEQHYPKFAVTEHSITTSNCNKTEILIEYADEQTLFAAKPAYVDDGETDKTFDEILETTYSNQNLEESKSPSVDTSYVSSSSMEDSIKIYNIQTAQIVKSKATDNVSYHNADDKYIDKTVLGEPNLSQNGELSEESLVIIENDSLKDKQFDTISEIEEILPQLPKVKELAKKFVSMENLNEPVKPQKPIRRRKSKDNMLDLNEKPKAVYMHSLTARSISKQFREELKLSMAIPLTVPGGTKEIPEGEEVTKESSRPGSPQPQPGTLKTKLAFFESLKSKFNSSK